MGPKDKARKRDTLLNPRCWVRRSRSPSPAASEHSYAASQTVTTLRPEVNRGPFQNSLPSHISASSLSHRPSTSPSASQSSTICLAISLSAPLSAVEESQSSPPSTSPLCSTPPPSPSPEPPTGSDELQPPPARPSDLWSRAFREANDATRKWIQEQGLDSDTPDPAQPKDQIKELISLMKSKKLADQDDNPLKIPLGNRKIIIREYIADAVAFITMVGDAAIAFAPPQASAPWAVAKAVMKIPVKQVEQMASLLGIVQWFTHIVRRGQIYKALYTTETTDGRAVSNLHDILVELYTAAIELLAKSDSLVKSGIARQTLTAVLRPNHASGLIAALSKKEKELDREVQICEASRFAISSKQTNDGIEDLKKQLDQLSSLSPQIDKGVASLLEKMNRKELEDLMDFISQEFGKSHAAVTDARLENTGDWLLAHDEFCAWQEMPSSSAVLCLQGVGGTGKTYLTSRVVDYVKQTLEASQHDEGFAFFYCNRSGNSMQEPLVVLRSLVRQLSGKAIDDSNNSQSSLIQRCAKAKVEGRGLTYKDCQELILESLNLYSRTTIILDALDESDTTEYNLAEILMQMMKVSKRPVKIFISSRPGREYLDDVLGDKLLITLDARNQQDDIEKFITDKLYSTKKFKRRNQEIQDEIKHVFKTRSCGMFRWVYLQVKSLEWCVTDEAVHSWAYKLPRTLTEAYDQLWARVEKYDEHDVTLAERAIMWVLCSTEPLRSGALLEAIRYTIEGSTVVRKERQTQQQILTLCEDLLTIDEKRGVWMLPHASVAEYFESKGWTNAKCDAFASKISLGVLENYENYDLRGAPRFTFFRYVRNKWFEHVGRYDKWLGSAKEADVDPELVAALKRFLGSPAKSSRIYRQWVGSCSSLRGKSNISSMALPAMCNFGFYYTLRDWWQNGNISEEMALEQNDYGRNSLALAAEGSCMPICKYLVGVINAKNPKAGKHSLALIEAMHSYNIDIAKFLVVEAKADVNFLTESYIRTPAQLAALCHPELLQWFVDQDALEVEGQNGSGHRCGNVLTEAVCEGPVESVRILLNAGADVNAAVKWGIYGSALVAAARRFNQYGHEEVMQLLLDSRADPNLPLRGGDYASALEAVVLFEYEVQEVRKTQLHMLLEAGADPTAVLDRGDHGSALAAAAFYGQKDLLKTMIDRVGRNRAMDALRRSRHPCERKFSDEQAVKRWKDTATYLAEEVGVGDEVLHHIGLWDVELEKIREEFYKYKLVYTLDA
ncbi:hypothetical protein V8C37DRAFT_178103 [Trichoderma ceciliae]